MKDQSFFFYIIICSLAKMKISRDLTTGVSGNRKKTLVHSKNTKISIVIEVWTPKTTC